MYTLNGQQFGFPVNISTPGLGQEAETLTPTETPEAPQTAYGPTTSTPAEVAPVTSAAEAKSLITALQQRLKSKGFDPGTIDGIWGPKTAAALDNARINAGLAAGADRVAIMQQALRLPYADAARVRDAINYQVAARKQPAAKQPTGTELAPSLPLVPTTASVPLTRKWWFWGLLAVGVVGAGVAAYFIIKKSREGSESEQFEPEGAAATAGDDEF